MKVFLVTDKDIDALMSAIDRNPAHGLHGGSSQVLNQVERDAHDAAHRFYNYQVREWIRKIGES